MAGLDWTIRTDDPDGHATVAAMVANHAIHHATFREIWLKFLVEVWPRNTGTWPRVMCYITEEPWQMIIVPTGLDDDSVRDHGALVAVDFPEHNGLLRPLEGNEAHYITVLRILADRLIQHGASALAEVTRELAILDRADMTGVRFEIWYSTDQCRVAHSREGTEHRVPSYS